MHQRWQSVIAMIVACGLWFVAALDSRAIAQAAESASAVGATVFTQNCAACHAGGGNIIRRGKTLKLKALQRNQVDTAAAIAQLVTQGKGNMSAYGERLSREEIAAVSAYVFEQATANWP